MIIEPHKTNAIHDALPMSGPFGTSDDYKKMRHHANDLEVQLTTSIRASLETLAERWDKKSEEWMSSDSFDMGIREQCDESAEELRRVLSGETPPAVGEEWKGK